MKLNPNPNRKFASTVTTTLIVLAAASTCLAQGYKRADKTGKEIASFREEIIKANEAVNATVKALDEVAATADVNPRKAFQDFSKSVKNLESASDKAKKRGQDMREKGQAYFAEWQKQLAQIKDPEIRKLASDQHAKLQATFSEIRKLTEPLKQQFDGWLTNLKDLEKYLSNDLSVSGVEAAKGLFAKAQEQGLAVQKAMDGLVAELNTVSATLTPKKVK